MSESKIKLPVTFWIVGVIALLWNLMGVMNFVMQVFMTDTMTAAMTPEQAELIMSTPGWLKFVFAVAVLAGLIGAIGLLMRKKWCVPVLLASLIAVVIQMGYSSFAMNSLEIMEQSAAFPAMIVTFSVVLWYYARRSDARGYLS